MKTLKDILFSWLNGSGGNKGLDRIPPLLGDNIDDLRKINLNSEQWSWISSFIIGIDALHNVKGHLKSLIKWIIKLKGFNESLFWENVALYIERKELSEFNGSHFRFLFSIYVKVIIPSIEKVDRIIQELLHKILDIWGQIQWILYLPPAAQTVRFIRLRLHVLIFLYLNLLPKVFPDSSPPSTEYFMETIDFTTNPPSDLLKEVINDWVKMLCSLLQITTKDPNFKITWCVNKRKPFSGQNKNELWQLFHNLRKKACREKLLNNDDRTRGKSGKVYVKTLMNLYLHTIVSHCASFYEFRDFRSTNTERFEAHLAFFKHIASFFTNRNFKLAQPIRELIVRQVSKSKALVLGYEKFEEPAKDMKIGRNFKDYTFTELKINSAEFDKAEVDCFLNELKKYNYVVGVDWEVVEDHIVFNTKVGCQKYHAERYG